MIWSWPARIPAGQSHDQIVSSLDLLPTFLAAAGSKPLPLTPPRSHEDKRNRQRMVKQYGEYDGVNVLPKLSGASDSPRRTLFWRLQGQAAVLDGKDKLITLSHRPPQLFRVATDVAESEDRFDSNRDTAEQLYQTLGTWQATLPTVPLWGSSPYWISESAKHYDTWSVRPEPK